MALWTTTANTPATGLQQLAEGGCSVSHLRPVQHHLRPKKKQFAKMRSFLLVIAALAMSHRAAANHLAGQSPCSGHICSYAGKCVVVNGLPKCQCNKFYKPKGLACVSALSKRGVGTWYTDTVEEALADSKVGWYYTWQPSSDQQAISPPPGMEFVPQVTTEAYTTAGIALAAASGSTVLAFNEPDVDPEPGNEALTVTQALDRWPKLMAMKRRLGSCATAGNPSEDGSWQEAFMKGAKARGYRVDFLAVHYYGWDSSRWDTATAVADLRGFLEDAHAKFGKPIWVRGPLPAAPAPPRLYSAAASEPTAPRPCCFAARR